MTDALPNWFCTTSDLPAQMRGGVVAIGNFDGVHMGHRAVLSQAKGIAHANGFAAIALTFEPHPRSFFAPDKPVFRLTPAKRKAQLLLDAGMDAVVSQTFDKQFSSLDAHAFITRHLIKDMDVSAVVMGYNFHFGKDRSGSPQMLQEFGVKNGFGVTLVPEFEDPLQKGQPVSSSRIRECLANGDIETANRLLTEPYEVSGIVVKGAQLGRTLGYPTANLRLPEEAILKHGIYAVRMRRADGSLHDGVASFGRRPTFDNGAPLLETYVFDFAGDLYGEVITIVFHGFLRAEEKFDSAEALVAQMDQDSEDARALLAKAPSPKG